MGNFLTIRPPKFNKLYLLSYIVRIITMEPNLKAVNLHVSDKTRDAGCSRPGLGLKEAGQR